MSNPASRHALPIEAILPKLRRALAGHAGVVLQAAPGAGKTTRVPLALLDEQWLGDNKIIMLEPRRLAARAAARFMARTLGERVGETVGYRVRLDTRVGPRTRIEVVTEGVLARLLQEDPALESVGLVIFDEFHERSLQADLGLALCLDSQEALREDLRLLVMSATLDIAPVAQLLRGAPVIASEGRSYPVDVHYHPLRAHFARERRAFADQLARLVLDVLRDESGSVLVFLPGVGEIRQLETALSYAIPGADVVVAPLYGQLDAAAQDTAIQPAAEGTRKVVLATSIAETSLTIEGIRVVIDAGLMRLQRFDPNTGLTRLVTLPVSQAASDQRCGRAGRLEPGVCYRLWPQHQHLQAHSPPEILEADLTPLVLELAQWGVQDVTTLCWLDTPPAAHVEQAGDLLRQLGALDAAGRMTAHGQAMIRLGAHPRLAHMMLRGRELGYAALACELAALLEERDPLAAVRPRDADLALRVEWLRGGGEHRAVNRRLRGVVREKARQWQRQLGCQPARNDPAELSSAGLVLAFAYPDRIAQRRKGSDNRFLLSNGRGARFAGAEPLAAQDYLVAAFLGGSREAQIFLAAAIDPGALPDVHPELLVERTFVNWDERGHRVQARHQQRLGELVLLDEPWAQADPQAVQSALLEGIRHQGLACLPWNEKARQLQLRIQFLHRLSADTWPDVSDGRLLESMEDWLLPYLEGMNRLAHLKRLDLHAMLLARLPWQQQRQLDELAPTHLSVPSGSRLRLDYGSELPVLAVRLQEMFGLGETPRVAGGRVAVLLHLLSPARRPVQVTQDLATFWKGGYQDVKKELRGRYPKHHWPDDPLQAVASSRVKGKRK